MIAVGVFCSVFRDGLRICVGEVTVPAREVLVFVGFGGGGGEGRIFRTNMPLERHLAAMCFLSKFKKRFV